MGFPFFDKNNNNHDNNEDNLLFISDILVDIINHFSITYNNVAAICLNNVEGNAFQSIVEEIKKFFKLNKEFVIDIVKDSYNSIWFILKLKVTNTDDVIIELIGGVYSIIQFLIDGLFANNILYIVFPCKGVNNRINIIYNYKISKFYTYTIKDNNRDIAFDINILSHFRDYSYWINDMSKWYPISTLNELDIYR